MIWAAVLVAFAVTTMSAQAAEVYWKGVASAGPGSAACTATGPAADRFASLGYDRALESSFRPGQLLQNSETWLILGHGPNLTGYHILGAGIPPANGNIQGLQVAESGIFRLFDGTYANLSISPANYDEATTHLSVMIRLTGVAGIPGCSITVRGRYVRAP